MPERLTGGIDSSGNLTTATVSGATTAFTTDAENRLTRSVAGSIVTTFTNDLYGRRTARITPSGPTTYTWDPSGHLSCVTSADTTVTYAYGITGMRESKIIETASGTTQTKSVWSGSELAAEQDSDGTVYRYLWGPDRTPLSVSVEYSTGATETFAYHTDALGSVVAMTDESGSVVARYSYDPYGRCTAATGEEIATRNPLRYRAYYADAETGLFYLPARYYDPATYRFLSQDPAAPSAGDPLSLNAYAYCLGDPVGASDPSGAVMVEGGGGGWTSDAIEHNAVVLKFIAAGMGAAFANAAQARQQARASHQQYLMDRANRHGDEMARRGMATARVELLEDERRRDNSSYGRWNTTMDRSRGRDNSHIAVESAGAALEITGLMVPALQVGGLGYDVVSTGDTIERWGNGEATCADVLVSAAQAYPGMSTAYLVIDLVAIGGERRLGWNVRWAVPRQ